MTFQILMFQSTSKKSLLIAIAPYKIIMMAIIIIIPTTLETRVLVFLVKRVKTINCMLLLMQTESYSFNLNKFFKNLKAKKYVGVLSPSASECGLIYRQGLSKGSQVKTMVLRMGSNLV